MRFSTNQHPFYWGIDLHARSMDVCIWSHEGDILVPRNMHAAPDPLRKAIAPSRDGLVVAVAWLFTWSWLAALCAAQGMPFVLGHALSRKALHGGKAKNDTSDAHKIAMWLRGGMLPQASVSPAKMRATRDLRRRRMHLMRQRADLVSQVHHTTSPSTLPAIGQKRASHAHREGVAERFADPAGQKNIAVDLARIPSDAARRKDLELSLVKTAKRHDAQPLSRLHTVPGMGNMLRLVVR